MAAASEQMKAMRARRREQVGQVVGRLGVEDMARLNVALAFVMGLGE